MNNKSIKPSTEQKVLPREDRSPDHFEVEWRKQINKGTPLEQPLVCDKCKATGNVYHVKSPIFFLFSLYLYCPKCRFHWKIDYEHTLPIGFIPDCTDQEKSASMCIRIDCNNPKMGDYNVCRDHMEEWT